MLTVVTIVFTTTVCALVAYFFTDYILDEMADRRHINHRLGTQKSLPPVQFYPPAKPRIITPNNEVTSYSTFYEDLHRISLQPCTCGWQPAACPSCAAAHALERANPEEE